MICTVTAIAEAKRGRPIRLPFYLTPTSAGFPSPAQDYIETVVDINEILIRQKASTFYLTVRGSSMEGAGIFDNDTLVVDRSISPVDGHIVVAVYDGHLVVKRLFKSKNDVMLVSENQDHAPIVLSEEDSITIWGVVTHSIKAFL